MSGCLNKRKRNVRYLCRVATAKIVPINPRSNMEKRLWVSHMLRISPLSMPTAAAANGPSRPPARVHGTAEKTIMVEPGGSSGRLISPPAKKRKNHQPCQPQPHQPSRERNGIQIGKMGQQRCQELHGVIIALNPNCY